MAEEKTYVLYRYTSPEKWERVEVKESALTKEEKNYMMGQMMAMWESMPVEVKAKFTRWALEDAYDSVFAFLATGDT